MLSVHDTFSDILQLKSNNFIQLFQVEIYACLNHFVSTLFECLIPSQKMASLRRTLTRLTIFKFYEREKELFNQTLIIADAADAVANNSIN